MLVPVPGSDINPLFDCPSAFEPFFTESVTVSVKGTPDFVLRASTQLNARDTAQIGDHFGDCWSVVFPRSAWPLASAPDRGTVLCLPNGDRLFVYRVFPVESCYHIQACSRLAAR